MKQINRFFILLIICCMLLTSSYAISVKQNNNNVQSNNNQTSNTLSTKVMGAVTLGLIIGLPLGLLIIIITYIRNKIHEARRKHSDLLYGNFLIELEKCHQNRDFKLKYRNWKTFFLTYKRGDVLINSKENGLRKFAKYDGELIHKDEFVLISIYRLINLFKRERDIIIVPYKLRKLLRKELHGKSYEMILDCESIDECLNTDYYAQMVIKSHKDNDSLINFNEYIQENFMKKYVYRQVIKDNLLDFKNSMDKAVELNPNIQVERKNPKQ